MRRNFETICDTGKSNCLKQTTKKLINAKVIVLKTDLFVFNFFCRCNVLYKYLLQEIPYLKINAETRQVTKNCLVNDYVYE